MTISEEYAKFITGLEYDQLSGEVQSYTKILLQDHIAVAVGGLHSPSAGIFIDSIAELGGGVPPKGGATVLATGEVMAPEYAAMLNGALAHSLDFDDTESGHPGAPVISAALATAEQSGATGRELVEGIVVGYEVTCRLFQAINRKNHYERGFHPTATCGLFGATAAVSKILGLSEEEITNAFGLNVSQVSGNHGYIHHGGWNKRLHPGIAANSAIVAVTFAKHGFHGTGRPFEGYQNFFYAFTDDPHPEIAVDGLGEDYWILGTGIKPYPCCRRLHTSIDVTLELVESYDIGLNNVKSIIVETTEVVLKNHAEPEGVKYHPSTVFEAQFSLPFVVAVAIAKQEFHLETLLGEMDGGYGKEIQQLMDRVSVTSTPKMDELADYERRPAEVTITTDTNDQKGFAEYPKGDPQNPMNREEINAKFMGLVEMVLSDERRTVLEQIRAIDEIDVADLLRPFRRAHEEPRSMSQGSHPSKRE